MLVLIPTAIPLEPFNNRLRLAGNIFGSFSVSS
jgi:hypothetical protein